MPGGSKNQQQPSGEHQQLTASIQKAPRINSNHPQPTSNIRQKFFPVPKPFKEQLSMRRVNPPPSNVPMHVCPPPKDPHPWPSPRQDVPRLLGHGSAGAGGPPTPLLSRSTGSALDHRLVCRSAGVCGPHAALRAGTCPQTALVSHCSGAASTPPAVIRPQALVLRGPSNTGHWHTHGCAA